MKKTILSAVGLTVALAFAGPAMAASHYYVAQSAKTKKCSVTTRKPDGKKMMVIGTSDYAKKADATAAMKAAAECKG